MNQRKEPTVSSVLDSKEDLAEKRARAARQRTTPRPPQSTPTATSQPSSSSGFVWFTFLITVIALVGAGYTLWQLQLAQQTLSEQRSRIVLLEKKLTISGDTANQSLASVSAKVRELATKSGVSTSEIDKLWATRNVNKKAIDANKEKLASFEKVQKPLAKLPKTVSTLQKKVNDVKKSVDPVKANVKRISQNISEQELLLQSLRERVTNQKATLASLSAQAKENAQISGKLKTLQQSMNTTEESLQSLEAFRRTVNRDLLQLKQNKAP